MTYETRFTRNDDNTITVSHFIDDQRSAALAKHPTLCPLPADMEWTGTVSVAVEQKAAN